ncbi:MAG: LPS assembly lipoprotein LptE [Bacteroidota bacterium]
MNSILDYLRQYPGRRSHFSKAWVLVLGLLSAFFFNACYSFKGISIDPRVNSFSVQVFENQASNAPPTLALDFTEKLKDKVRSETRLVLKGTEPDVEFSGKITDFRVVPVAPKPGETVAVNRLEIRIKVGYINNVDQAKGWKSERDFSFFQEFPSDKELLVIQSQLVGDITKQLLEDVFNAAFNDW